MNDHKNALPAGTVLDGRYRIEAVLGAGGFGIVYRAVHTQLGKTYAIKEYLPTEVAVREGTSVHALSSGARAHYDDGLERFLREARQLVQFDGHRNIVTCADYFDGNGTAYLVMVYEDGLPLSELIARREAQGRPFDQDETVRLLRPLLEGLRHVHQRNVLHRDIKPGNIFIRRSDEEPVLLDFGAAKGDFSVHSKSGEGAYTVGYAAMEQVEREGALGPWTDIHAIGGVLYRIIAGDNPPDVNDRLSAKVRERPDPLVLDAAAVAGRFSAAFVAVVSDCMALREEDRIQDVDALLSRIDAATAGAGAPRPEAPQPEPTKPTKPEPAPAREDPRPDASDHRERERPGPQSTPGHPAPVASSGRRKALMIGVAVLGLAGVIAAGVIYDQRQTLDALLVDAEAALDEGAYADASSLLDEAQALDADHPTVTELQGELEDALGGESVAERIETLLADAERAYERNRLTRPSDDNAARWYRAALGIDPDNRDAERGLERVVDRYADLADAAIDASDTERARSLLERGEEVLAGQPRIEEMLARLDTIGEVSPQLQRAIDAWYWRYEETQEVLGWIRSAAEQGDPVAAAELAKQYWVGRGEVDRDRRRARELARKALPGLEAAADSGEPHAEYLLGWYRSKEGLVGGADHDAAMRWYRRAARQGYALAHLNIGYHYHNGLGVDQDYERAREFYEYAADRGLPTAHYNLGNSYRYAKGVKKDYAKAVAYFRQAAKGGEPEAWHSLGDMYRNGHGVKTDNAEAIKWYRKAAEYGHRKGQFGLGWMYKNGLGVARDYAEAARWYRLASEQGNAAATNNLGSLYEHGRGVPKDEDEAVRLYREAAKAGNDTARDNIRRLRPHASYVWE